MALICFWNTEKQFRAELKQQMSPPSDAAGTLDEAMQKRKASPVDEENAKELRR